MFLIHDIYESRFFLLCLLENRRIRIQGRIRILEAQKHVDPVDLDLDSDPEHCLILSLFRWNLPTPFRWSTRSSRRRQRSSGRPLTNSSNDWIGSRSSPAPSAAKHSSRRRTWSIISCSIAARSPGSVTCASGDLSRSATWRSIWRATWPGPSSVPRVTLGRPF